MGWMSNDTSMIYTVGMALNRAYDDACEVDVLADGEWLSGAVALHDGTSVVLAREDEHSIVLVSKIEALRVKQPVPDYARRGGGIPMPGPRRSAEQSAE